MLDIRRATASDVPAIHHFLREAYGPLARFKASNRWAWQFVNNPYATDDAAPPVWVAADGTRIVGQIAVQWGVARTPVGRVPFGWIVDVMVLEEYRGRSLGHRLYEAVASDVPVLLTLTMAPATRRMAGRLDAVTVGNVWQMVRLVAPNQRDIREYLLTRSQHRPRVHGACRILSRCGLDCIGMLGARAVAASIKWRTSGLDGDSSVKVSEIDRFDQDVDRFWERIAATYPLAQERTAEFLNWRFVACPDLSYRRYVARRVGDLVGILVVRECEAVEFRTGIIAEVLVAQGDMRALRAMVQHAIAAFGDQVAAVECGTSIAEMRTELRRLGFVQVRTHSPTVVCQDGRLREYVVKHPTSWLMSKADHDWDQVHLSFSAEKILEGACDSECTGTPPDDVPNSVAKTT